MSRCAFPVLGFSWPPPIPLPGLPTLPLPTLPSWAAFFPLLPTLLLVLGAFPFPGLPALPSLIILASWNLPGLPSLAFSWPPPIPLPGLPNLSPPSLTLVPFCPLD